MPKKKKNLKQVPAPYYELDYRQETDEECELAVQDFMSENKPFYKDE